MWSLQGELWKTTNFEPLDIMDLPLLVCLFLEISKAYIVDMGLSD